MLPFFPTPYFDELLYGVFARYHQRSGHTSVGHTMRDLLGSRQAVAVVDLPTRLASIVDRLPPQTSHTASELIEAHTMFPLHRPFLPVSRVELIVSLMTGENRVGNVHMTIGQTASCVPSIKYLRYCPSCLRSDESNYGEPYWHRSHQVPGIRTCHLHCTSLADSEVAIGGNGLKQSLVPLKAEPLGLSQPLLEVQNNVDHLWLAAAAHTLLNDGRFRHPLGLEELRRRYCLHLHGRGLASTTGRLECRTLIERFRVHYGDLLTELHCGLPENDADNWLFALLRRQRKTSHPLHHLLLIRFLGLEIEEFFLEDVSGPRPFGMGPWPCLNRAAPHFRKAVIATCSISRNTETGAPVGTFVCRCGFAYSRSGPDRCKADRSKIARIVAVGMLWEKRLEQIVIKEKRSLREAARQLEVDTKTVKRHLECCSHGNSCNIHRQAIGHELALRRTSWQELGIAHPEMGVKALRRIGDADYAWLYRHDRGWLRAHMPPRAPRTPPAGRVDWPERDAQLAGRIELAVEAILQYPGRPARVTATAIGNKIGSTSLLRKLDRLPQTRAALEAVVETREAFAIRRLRLAAKKLSEQGERLAVWKLRRQAGLRPNYSGGVARELEKMTEGGRRAKDWR